MSTDGRTYWRSLEQLADDPRAREFLEREFPENASELPQGITRRTMLTLLGASLSAAGLSACRRPVEKIVPYVEAPEQLIPGVPLYFATTMSVGHSAYGLVVESHEGRPTKIEGNREHPSTLGASSAAIQASILNLYDPDRSAALLHGEETKTWEDFQAAWVEIEAWALESRGAGLAVLLRPHSSPTIARLTAAFRARYPEAHFVHHDPISDENVHAGVEQAFGAVLQPVYHFDRASVVLALDSDFLLTEPENIRHARGFADSRRVSSTSDGMSRLYVAESGLSLTGGNADHRLRLQSGQAGALLAGLAMRMAAGGLALPSAGVAPRLEVAGSEPWIEAVASDLLAARGTGLIVVGRQQPPEVHAAAMALNHALGNVGRTVTLHEMKDAGRSSRSALAELARAMNEGEVRGLVVLGGNPAYDAPADLEFGTAMQQVGQVVHLSCYPDETSRLASWRLPQAHYLESWGDARAADGTTSVVQPLIAPLFGGRSVVELLGLMAGGGHVAGHDLVRESWASVLGETDFERRWNRVLHDGLLADSGTDPQAPHPGPDALAELFRTARGEAATPSDLEIVFRPSPSLFDGRYANNGWLQELPDAVTKLTWDNAALVSPDTATALQVSNEDLVELEYDGRRLTLPVWIVPGQVNHSVALHLGWGRESAGRVGNGRGFNGYALRTSARPDYGRGLTVTPAGGSYPLSQTQDHGSMEGRALFREASLAKFRQRPDFVKDDEVAHPPLESLWKDRTYDEGYQWGMTIDLNACTGCNACVTACQSENNIPIVGKQQVAAGREMHWIRVDRYFTGDPEDPQAVFQPVPCMQCENAPCEQVCPVAATVHDAEGLNTMVYNRCIGTRYCSNNCPYKVRRFNFFNFTKDTPEVQQMAYNPDVTVRSRGVMEKCTYCTQRINAGKIRAKLEGVELQDGDIETACQQSCPTRAISFGNIRDPQSRVSTMKSQDRNYVMIAELNNRPRTSYLAKLRNPNPALEQS